MANVTYPGVYMEEVSSGVRPIQEGVETHTCLFGGCDKLKRPSGHGFQVGTSRFASSDPTPMAHTMTPSTIEVCWMDAPSRNDPSEMRASS